MSVSSRFKLCPIRCYQSFMMQTHHKNIMSMKLFHCPLAQWLKDLKLSTWEDSGCVRGRWSAAACRRARKAAGFSSAFPWVYTMPYSVYRGWSGSSSARRHKSFLLPGPWNTAHSCGKLLTQWHPIFLGMFPTEFGTPCREWGSWPHSSHLCVLSTETGSRC